MQRDARHEAIVQALLDRVEEDREAREKRLLRYRQSLDNGSDAESDVFRPAAPNRLHKFRTKVPCRVTPEASALLEQLKKQFPGSTVTFPYSKNREQAVMLTRGAGAEPKQIGWVEHCVETDPKLCNARHQGLEVTTDGGVMLVFRFRYPATPARLSARRIDTQTRINELISAPQDGDRLDSLCGTTDETACLDFTETRPALDLQPRDDGAAPRLVWVTRPEVDMMDALGSRDYEAFYVRFKLEVQAGIWKTLTGLLSRSPAFHCHRGTHYTVVYEQDVSNGRVYQSTVDDTGNPADIGLDRVYDTPAATDIVLLHLGADILADFADIYFTLQGAGSADVGFLKDEFFRAIREFWARTPSLTSRYGDDLTAVERMSQRVVPTPAQGLLLKSDWSTLRQSLVDRFGEGGRNALDLIGAEVDRPRNAAKAWPFASFPTGEVNVGLRLVYRQEWRRVGAQRGEVLRTSGAKPSAGVSDARSIETTIEQSEKIRNLKDVVADAADAAVAAMKWSRETEGSINTGIRSLAATTDLGLESECRASSRHTSTRLTDVMLRMASRLRAEATEVLSAEPEEDFDPSTTLVYRKLQHQYEVLTRPAEIQNVVLVAEPLPAPSEIDFSWVKQHDWILGKVLLDESFREALSWISEEAGAPETSASATIRLQDEVVQHADTFAGTATVRANGVDMSGEWKRGYRYPAEEQLERLQYELERDAKRQRLYEHLRANILHYQRAIWQHEDPQQRSMRYRKSGRKVPLEWRFELESGSTLTIETLGNRLTALNVDGHFAAYSAGRQADLDELIDPAGPVGFYGNYAIYPMRPEFAGADLFSMLHFFKSAYLRGNPETGEPEVADPLQIETSDDRFRLERARRIAIDTEAIVVDVIRDAEPATDAESSEDAADPGAAPNGYELILEGACAMELHNTSAPREAATEWTILPTDAEQNSFLIAGGGRVAAPAEEPAPTIIPAAEPKPTPILVTGNETAHPQSADRERMILARDAERLRPFLLAG